MDFPLLKEALCAAALSAPRDCETSRGNGKQRSWFISWKSRNRSAPEPAAGWGQWGGPGGPVKSISVIAFISVVVKGSMVITR